MPTTFTVTSPADVPQAGKNPPLTLREAIGLANADHTAEPHSINFAPFLTGATMSLESQLPIISKSMLIDGLGAFSLTVARGSSGHFRLFEIGESSVTSISNIKLTGGYVDGSGGAIKNNGELSVSNAIVSNNTAEGGYGGAIYSAGPMLTVGNTILSYNTAGGGGAIGVGGGFFGIVGGYVQHNSADIGGGIYLATLPGGSSNISGVKVSDNFADDGGGIYSRRSLNLTDGTDIYDNAALGTAGRGGGVYMQYGTITYANVRIGNNDASSGDGVYREAGTSRAGTGVTWYGTPADQEVVGT